MMKPSIALLAGVLGYDGCMGIHLDLKQKLNTAFLFTSRMCHLHLQLVHFIEAKTNNTHRVSQCFRGLLLHATGIGLTGSDSLQGV